jgi:nitroreductase
MESAQAALEGTRLAGGSDIDVQMVDRLLTTTRAVRKRFDFDRPVGEDVVTDCLRIAMQAPNGSNGQNWHWVVVTDAEMRLGLAELYKRAFAPYLAMGRGAKAAEEIASGSDSTVARRQAERLVSQKRIMDSVLFLIENLWRAPVMVIPCISGRPSPDAPHVWVASLYASIYPAVWSFQLALRARGLGSCLTTAHLGLDTEAAQLLGIPDNVLQVALIPVAYYTGSYFRPGVRRAPELSISWNGW